MKIGLSGACLLLWLVMDAQAQPPKTVEVVPGKQAGKQVLKTAERIRPACPIRIGAVILRGLGEKSQPQEDSAAHGVKLTKTQQDWLAENCDVVALDARCITPDTFPAIYKTQHLFTPLLYVYASTLYEKDHKGNVGGWQPEMHDWTLRDAHGAEVSHPDAGGHWMDFGSEAWAKHWREQVQELTARYHAQGVVAAELPLGNTFVGESLARYHTPLDRMKATGDWLAAAHNPNRFLLIPSAFGFDDVAGHPTKPTPPKAQQPDLHGRLWDDYYDRIDGAWAEGWLLPYWTKGSVREDYWEIQLEAADRAGLDGQVFIAGCAYRNTAELEFALASFLLVAHRQGRVVIQPMPQIPGIRQDAGYSLAVLQQEFKAHRDYFTPPLGIGTQGRHIIPVDGGGVWRRTFTNGTVYVNSSDRHTVTVNLGGPMRRVTGEKVRRVVLPPHSGVILLDVSVSASA